MHVPKHRYGAMLRVEETLASYLSSESASSLKALTLPAKPCRTTLFLVGKAYVASSQAGACPPTMALLQTCQASLIRDLDEGEGRGPDANQKLGWTSDLALCTTNKTAHSVGRSIAAMVSM